MSAGIQAIQTLTKLGYKAWVEGEAVRLKYEGPDDPDPGQVRPLLDVVKAHKKEVLEYLARPKAPSPPERILSCEECPWYQVNPWTHYPELGAWCHYHMEGILTDNPSCISFRRGEIVGFAAGTVRG